MPSAIEWTDETWNPVTGCTRVSPGCDNCYMFALYPRLKLWGVPGYGDSPDRVSILPERLQTPLTWKRPKMVFVNSMSDLFHRDIPGDFILQVFKVMERAAAQGGHIFQVLTKRPGRAVAWWKEYAEHFPDGWPANIWIGTSVENQKYAPRLTVLARLPAPVQFVSAEPLLGAIDLTAWLENRGLKWIIAGGESGRGARAMDLEWARSLRDQALRAGVPFFFKQLGGVRKKGGGDAAILDGRTWREMPFAPSMAGKEAHV